MSIKRALDLAYSARFINLLRKPFEEWGAYNKGIINKKGRVIKRKRDDDWTKFHQMVASIKTILNKGSSKAPQLASLYLAYKTIKEEYNLDLDEAELYDEFPLFEDMVAGDAGGNPSNIAAGTNSGSVVNKRPQTMGKTRKKKKMNEVISFGQFKTDIKEADIAKELAEKELAIKMNEVHSFSFKALGGNSVVVEATEIEVKSVSINGHTSQAIDEAKLVESYKDFGKEGVLEYIKASTNLVWRTI